MPPRTAPIRSEELANAASHGVGLLLSLAAFPVLTTLAARRGDRGALIGASVFALTMVLLYFASAVYHALPGGRAKDLFNRVDHAAIYLFIAGTFTPFALGPAMARNDWAPLALVWGLALAGTWAKACNRLRHRAASTALYMALAWLALAAAAPLLLRLPPEGLALLLGGGLAYSVGAVFFHLDRRLAYGHFIWHLFVLVGSTCHFFAALRHAAA